MMPAPLGFFIATLAAAAAPAPQQGPQTFSGEYTVSYLGLPIARSRFDTTVEKGAFSAKGSLASAGLAQLFDSTRGTVSTAGRFSGKTTQPAAFRVDYTEGRSRSTSIHFEEWLGHQDGECAAAQEARQRLVPLKQSHLRSVTAPLAAALVRADSLAEVCGRTIRVYDGEIRADLTLVRETNSSISVPGYEGRTVTCRVHFNPVAGYRQGRRALEFLKNRSQIRVAFAPLGTPVYAPIHATVGTQIGTLTISARRFEIAR